MDWPGLLLKLKLQLSTKSGRAGDLEAGSSLLHWWAPCDVLGRLHPGGLDSAVFCTKRISIHLLASHTNGLSYSPACGSAIDSSLLGEGKTPVLPSPPQPLGVAEVATRLSSIHLGKLGREGPKEARELNSPPRTVG